MHPCERKAFFGDEIGDNACIIFDDSDVADVDPHMGLLWPQPVFLLAVCLVVLLFHSHRCITIMLPKEHMGIPATSLSMRHLLRIHFPIKQRTSVTIHDIISKFQHLASFSPYAVGGAIPDTLEAVVLSVDAHDPADVHKAAILFIPRELAADFTESLSVLAAAHPPVRRGGDPSSSRWYIPSSIESAFEEISGTVEQRRDDTLHNHNADVQTILNQVPVYAAPGQAFVAQQYPSAFSAPPFVMP